MMKIKHIDNNRYVINGRVMIARNYKDAIREYVEIFGTGARVFFAKKG